MTIHSSQPIRIWDLPTRLFHWALALCVIGAIVTVKLGGLWMDWHLRLGVAALALVIFRLIWGLVGPRYARFRQFVVSPASTLRYLKNQAPQTRREPGHNPLGAWSVLALLCLIAYQAITGLFANDDIMVQGPLAAYVSSDLSAMLTGWHKLTEKLIVALIALHIIAIVIYRIKGKNLIGPMLTGNAPADELSPGAIGAKDDWKIRLTALLIAIILGAGAWWLITLASQAAPSFG